MAQVFLIPIMCNILFYGGFVKHLKNNPKEVINFTKNKLFIYIQNKKKDYLEGN